jgi:hypothetical protein
LVSSADVENGEVVAEGEAGYVNEEEMAEEEMAEEEEVSREAAMSHMMAAPMSAQTM